MQICFARLAILPYAFLLCPLKPSSPPLPLPPRSLSSDRPVIHLVWELTSPCHLATVSSPSPSKAARSLLTNYLRRLPSHYCDQRESKAASHMQRGNLRSFQTSWLWPARVEKARGVAAHAVNKSWTRAFTTKRRDKLWGKRGKRTRHVHLPPPLPHLTPTHFVILTFILRNYSLIQQGHMALVESLPLMWRATRRKPVTLKSLFIFSWWRPDMPPIGVACRVVWLYVYYIGRVEWK